jgi:CBS-domain-containing membrane protein
MTQEKPAPCAADFMTRHVQTVMPDMSLGDVVRFLLEHKISNAPVVEYQDQKPVLIGFISERDCLEFLSNEAFYGLPVPLHTARTIMRNHPVCVSPDTELFTLASIFSSHGYRHLPVIEYDELVGIVSRCDVLKAMEEYYQDAIKTHDELRFRPDLRKIANLRFLAKSL